MARSAPCYAAARRDVRVCVLSRTRHYLSASKPDSTISMKIPETKSILPTRRGLTRWAAYHQFAVELSETAKLALPMVLTQLGQIAMITIDLALIGRIGVEALAAAALAGRVYLVSFTLGVGLLAPVAPIAAQAFAANDLALARRSLRVGLWLALLISFPIMTLALHGEQMLLAFGQTPGAARLAQKNLFGLA